MRYALRNKRKIVEHFNPKGVEVLNGLIKSLDDHFKANGTIVLSDGEPFKTLTINNTGDQSAFIVFHVIGIRFDVYRLAFKEFIS